MSSFSNASPFASLASVRSKRRRSDSMDDDSTDSRPSKRSRSSSDDSSATPVVCPPAPKKAPRPIVNPEDSDDDSVGPLRNLAEQMAEAVLAEPSSPPSPIPPVDDGPILGWGGEENYEEDWCISVTCSDLALRLDMRHPRVVLNFLRFVSSYNELVSFEERIHLPPISERAAHDILSHPSVIYPTPEFKSQIAELRALVAHYCCRCADCGYGSYSE